MPKAAAAATHDIKQILEELYSWFLRNLILQISTDEKSTNVELIFLSKAIAATHEIEQIRKEHYSCHLSCIYII